MAGSSNCFQDDHNDMPTAEIFKMSKQMNFDKCLILNQAKFDKTICVKVVLILSLISHNPNKELDSWVVCSLGLHNVLCQVPAVCISYGRK